MNEFLLWVAVLGLGFMLWLTRNDLRFLQRRIAELEERPGDRAPAVEVPPEPVAEQRPRIAAKVRRTATVTAAAPPPPVATDIVLPEAEPEQATEPRPSPFADLSFENLVGGKLPIWIGGIALVFAGFFLVRYTIEAGLFGPGARSIAATLFALSMIAISELGGRLPKVGTSFAADPRLGQSLAGAGVATLYGTLYMAAEIYGLVGVPTAFVLVLLTTAIAFALSLRHGPPTALMGLVGGFAAPWVAGMGASNLPSLLLYLAVFIAALFGLAIWRRWLWLLVLASSGGLFWSLAMLVTAKGNLGLLGGFIAVTGGGAILASKRFGTDGGVWNGLARYAPMVLALVQLALLLPKMDFSLLGWIFYFALAALAIALAWRDRTLLPLVAGALLLAMGPLGLGWSEQGATPLNIGIALALAALFGIAGHVRARCVGEQPLYWAIVGLAAPVLVWFTASLSHDVDADRIWGALALLAVVPAAWTAWEWHSRKHAGTVQPWATGAAALMLWMGCIVLIDEQWSASYSALVALAIAAWAKITGGRAERRLGLVPLGAAMILASAFSYSFVDAIGASLSGEGAFFSRMPPAREAMRTTLIPALLITAMAWPALFAAGRRTRALALTVGGAGLTAFIWLLAKHPAAIQSPSDFIRTGFAERAVFTQILFAVGWTALHHGRKRAVGALLPKIGWVLIAAALFRIIWFDLLIHNPVADPQMVGPVPVANLLVGYLALVALWLWLLAQEVKPRWIQIVQSISLGAMMLTILALVRQAVQGTFISGGYVGTGENYFYSAGLLALAIAWLVLGIRQNAKLLRVAGLSLLTVVTLKVFLIDAAALAGLLRILSFLGLGIALIGIGWAYGRVMALNKTN